VERVHRRAVAPVAPAADLGDQIALIDAARSAVAAGSTERALVLLRRYDSSYPRGAFQPEALALRVEALAAAGRTAEAQALARDFLARYPQSPVADRVAHVAETKSR
jgi:outer membrane protein assembly factor BamD (BamD/ComL family)